MKKLKCESCGAILKIDENDKNYAICEYCGSKYKLNEDLNININIDDDVKETLKTGSNIVKNVFIGHQIVFFIVIIFTVLIFATIIFLGIKGFRTKANNNDVKYNDIFDNKDPKNEKEESDSEFDADFFNSSFLMFSGVQKKFFVETLLNSIVRSNSINDKKIAVNYNNQDITDNTEINKINSSLTDKNYEISFGFDEKGFINKAIIK